MGSLSLLQGIFPTQGSNLGLLHCRRIVYQLSHKGSPRTRVGSLSLFQQIFLTQESNRGLLNCRWILYQLSLDSILKSRDITFPTKVCLVKAVVFPIVMCGYECWTIKKAECWRINAFELWCWRRLLRIPWTARRSNQSILKQINPENSFEGLMLKLKLQYFGHLRQRTDSFRKDPDAGKD